MEVVVTIDRRLGIISYWVKGTDHVVVIRDDKICTGEVVPVYIHWKEESWCKLKQEPKEDHAFDISDLKSTIGK